MHLRSFSAFLSGVLFTCTLALVGDAVDENGNLMAKPRIAATLIQTVMTPVPQPLLAPKPARAVPAAAAPVPSTPDETVKLNPPSETPLAPVPPAIDNILQADSQNRISAPVRDSKITAYAAAGTSVVLGLIIPSDGGLNYRLEYSEGYKPLGTSKTHGGGKYTETNTQQRLGVFVDWSPAHNNWLLTGGLTLNRQKFHFQAKSSSTMTINGKNVPNFTGQSFSIDYSLPKLTPYVGVRYAHPRPDPNGWEGFAEVGAVLAKLDAEARISDGISPNPIGDSDVKAEIHALRQSLYKWGVVPHAVVGLRYRY